MSIKSLFIPCVEFDYLAMDMIDAFYTNGIATVSKITYIPFSRGETFYYRAYVDIHEWHNTVAAENFILRLTADKYESRFIYEDDSWFVVKINKLPNYKSRDGYTFVNWLVYQEAAEMPKEQHEDPEWKDIQRELYEMDKYRNLEYELCL
jgi:hypothetical protein